MNAVYAVTPLMTRMPDYGKDYGKPRDGVDAFDFIFRQLAIHPPSKGCVTVQGPNGADERLQMKIINGVLFRITGIFRGSRWRRAGLGA